MTSSREVLRSIMVPTSVSAIGSGTISPSSPIVVVFIQSLIRGFKGAISFRTLMVLAAACGCWDFVRHLLHFWQVLRECWSRDFLWAAPVQLFLIWTAAMRVLWRRLCMKPRSKRWSIAVELFVEITTPHKVFLANWETCVSPTMRILTCLDYHGETVAKLFHRDVHLETHTQGCPRPVTWVVYGGALPAATPCSSLSLGSDDGAMETSDQAKLPKRKPSKKKVMSPGRETRPFPQRYGFEDHVGEDAFRSRTRPPLPPNRDDLVVLYLHGGGYWAFTGKSHLEYVSRLVKELTRQTGRCVKACVVDTRRAPENPWPAPVEDAVACYEWLQTGCGYKAEQVLLAGDSAGGGLCLCLLLALRDAGKELPLCAMVVSPLTDLTRTEEEYPAAEHLVDFLPAAAAVVSGQYYTQGEDCRHPLISPKYGELHSLPPVLVQAGEGELLARDSVEYARRLEAYGGSVKLEMYPDMPHIFPMLAPLGLQDANTAIERQGLFLHRVLKGWKGEKRGSRVRILVHDGRKQSFEDLRRSLTEAANGLGAVRSKIGSSSTPVLESLGLQKETAGPLCQALFHSGNAWRSGQC